MTEDNNRSDLGSEEANNSPGSSAKRIEDLLMDDAEAPRATFRDIAYQEVQSGAGVNSSLRWPLAILAVLIVAIVVVVVGWYQFGDLKSGQSAAGGKSGVEKRMAMPERSQLQDEFQGDAAEEITAAAVAAEDEAQQEEDVPAEIITEPDSEDSLNIAEEPLSAVAEPAAESVASGQEESAEVILISAEVAVSEEQQADAGSPPAEVAEPDYRVLVGPFISQGALERAEELLRGRGFVPEQQHGSGTVDMIRLLEGIYPLAQAQQRLEEIRKEFSSAFLLPDGGRWALYIGSFSERDRARRQQRDLAERQIEVAQVDSQLTLEGPLLVVVRSGLKAAEEVATDINTSGLRARIEVER